MKKIYIAKERILSYAFIQQLWSVSYQLNLISLSFSNIWKSLFHYHNVAMVDVLILLVHHATFDFRMVKHQVHGPYLLGMDSNHSRTTDELHEKHNTIHKWLCQDQKSSMGKPSLDELLHFLGILLSMEVFEIHGPRKMYWNEEGTDLSLAKNFGKIMCWTRFKEIAWFLQLLIWPGFWSFPYRFLMTAEV